MGADRDRWSASKEIGRPEPLSTIISCSDLCAGDSGAMESFFGLPQENLLKTGTRNTRKELCVAIVIRMGRHGVEKAHFMA